MYPSQVDARSATLFLICTYEAVALVSPLPTISALVKTVRHHPATWAAVGTVSTYLAFHLLVEEF